MRLIKLHIGLFRYLKLELKKKRTIKELLKFLKDVGVLYIKEILNLSKSLFLIFDKDYHKKKKEYRKHKQIQADLRRCIKMLKYIDEKMEKSGISRQRRKQFWRDFYSHGEVRKDVFENLLKEINQFK